MIRALIVAAAVLVAAQAGGEASARSNHPVMHRLGMGLHKLGHGLHNLGHRMGHHGHGHAYGHRHRR